MAKLTIHEKGVSGKLTVFDPLMKSKHWLAAKLESDPETGQTFTVEEKNEGAKFIIDHLWSKANSAELLLRLGDKTPVFLPVPSTTGANVLASYFAKILYEEFGGEILEGFQFIAPLHQVPMKDIPSQYRPFIIRKYFLENKEILLSLTANKAVVVVDDVFSTGASAKYFCNYLKLNQIQVHTVAGLIGDTRLTAEPQLISKLQRTLKNSNLTQLKAKNITDQLSRGQIIVLIDLINKTKSHDELGQIAGFLQIALDGGTVKSLQRNLRGPLGIFANIGRNGYSGPDAD
ncbi:MAG: phosphoribosyltransferase [Deltaproteobacteria bacterium]|jgi:hypothetical protein|nr:phosphoribosyltransferase [Deltaproteobacteria bacterium]